MEREEDVFATPLPGCADDYIRDSIDDSLGLPVSDHSLRLKLPASEDHRRRLQDHVFALEEDLRATARRIELLKLTALANEVHVLQKDKENLRINLNKAEEEVKLLFEENKILDEENKKLLALLEKERQHRSERKHSSSASTTKHKRKSSSLKETSPVGRTIDFNRADSSRHPLSPLPPNSPDYRAHKK